jgi:hypothetical protein
LVLRRRGELRDQPSELLIDVRRQIMSDKGRFDRPHRLDECLRYGSTGSWYFSVRGMRNLPPAHR